METLFTRGHISPAQQGGKCVSPQARLKMWEAEACHQSQVESEVSAPRVAWWQPALTHRFVGVGQKAEDSKGHSVHQQ